MTAIKALCITEDPDRPTTATFVGLHRAGVDLTVVCPAGAADSRAVLAAAGVKLLDLKLGGLTRSRRARSGCATSSSRGRYDVLHVFSNRPLESGIAAAARAAGQS